MRILLDLRLAAYQPAGIGRYAIRLAETLPAVAPDFEVTCLVAARRPRPKLSSRIRQIPVVTPPHFRWEAAALTVETARLPRDVTHWPDFLPAARRRGPTAITIHDLAYLHRPVLVTPDSFRYYSQIREAAAGVDAVIAVSEATRQAAIAELSLPDDRVVAIPHGVEAHFSPESHAEDAGRLASYGLRAPYILFLGTLEPRKNLNALVRAYSLARQSGLPKDIPLVLAGGRGWLSDEIYRAAYMSAERGSILFPGRIREADLPALYRSAASFVLPSLDEGFGLPVLEALTCGTPVVCSDLPALREVAGEAAGYAESGKDEELAAALLAVFHKPAATAGRVRAGLERARAYTWQRAAEETAAVYRRIVS